MNLEVTPDVTLSTICMRQGSRKNVSRSCVHSIGPGLTLISRSGLRVREVAGYGRYTYNKYGRTSHDLVYAVIMVGNGMGVTQVKAGHGHRSGKASAEGSDV